MSTGFERDIIEYERRTGDRLVVGPAFDPTDPSTYEELGRQLGDGLGIVGGGVWSETNSLFENWNPVRRIDPQPQPQPQPEIKPVPETINTGVPPAEEEENTLLIVGGIAAFLGLVGFVVYQAGK